MKKFIYNLSIIVLFHIGIISFAEAQNMRGIWVWNTNTVLPSTNEVNILINQCKVNNITEIYLYTYNRLTTVAHRTQLRTFISKARCNNINVWAMDGYRGWFSDWDGPALYYNFINQVIAYNASSAANERFIGVHGDNEPQDGQGEPLSSYHNTIPSSALSNVPGSGVWQSTEALDREFLMRDWCLITETAATMCHTNAMLYGQAMVAWLDDYYGEPVFCTYNTVNKRVLEHIMDYVDDYCIMTYNTNPANAANRAVGELTYANTIPLANRPRVWASVETHCGPGNTISYCDTPGKNSKAAVLADMATITATLSAYASFSGLNIHDWAATGWKEMPTASSNIADPGCTLPITIIHFDGKNAIDYNILRWSTIDEKNFSHFEIEFSKDGILFETLGMVKKNITTNTKNNYSFTHYHNETIPLYYRLKAIDVDDSYAFSDIIVLTPSFENEFFLSPSPARDILTINFNKSLPAETSILVSDIRGSILISKFTSENINMEFNIDISSLSSGLYLVKIENRNTTPRILKFLKQ